jgi:hypothetical protein
MCEGVCFYEDVLLGDDVVGVIVVVSGLAVCCSFLV